MSLWTGYPETAVTQLTYGEWLFSLGARREVQIGYSVRVQNAWELFGNGHWVWFTGAVAGGQGAVQIVAQWAEVEPLGPRQRVWQWVHWRNPLDVDVIVRPYLLLAPPVEASYLGQAEQTNVRKKIWTITDVLTDVVVGLGTALTGPFGEDGGGTDGGGGGLEAVVALRPLHGQQLREIELEGDLRYLPPHELWNRIGELTGAAAPGPEQGDARQP